MTDQPASTPLAPDNGPALIAVSTATDMFKAMVRAAAREDRWRLWTTFDAGLGMAKDKARESGDALPWEDADLVTMVQAKDVQQVMEDTLLACIEEPQERIRILQPAIPVYERSLASGNGKPIKSTRYGIRVCARPGCNQRFAAKSPRHIWHSSTCRAAAHKAAQRGYERDQENVPAGAA
jgi:hypothetical protein